MLLKKLIENVKIKEKLYFDDIEISSLEIDSRLCKDGSLYFAISGTQVDGHDFAVSAVKNGAKAIVCERELAINVPQIIVDDTREAMSLIAANYYLHPAKKLKMVGITGTNGKTSISYMLSAIAKKAKISCGVIGTSGISVDNKKLDIKILTSTTPDPIQLQQALAKMVEMGAKWCVMEVTAHALDLRKTAGIFFESAGFTNLTQDHLDYFGTMENYAGAKAKLFEKEKSAIASINIDDEFGEYLLKNASCKQQTYSCKNQKADFFADNIEIGSNCSKFLLTFNKEKFNVKVNMTGLFNISNALCSIAMANALGVDIKTCIMGIEDFVSVPGRFEAVDTGDKDISVIIDYAHSPDGIENVLKAINSFKKGKLICVFGCGGNRDSAKRPIMGKIAGELADECVLTSDNPRFEKPNAIIDEIEVGIKETNCPYKKIADRREAILQALKNASKNDVIAILGKGDEDYQEINGEKHHFSDRETVEELLEEIL